MIAFTDRPAAARQSSRMSTHPDGFPLVERLGPDDFAALLALYEEVAASLPTGRLQRRDAANVASYLGGGFGGAFGIRQQGRLVAAGLLGAPRTNPRLALPPFPGIPPADWPAQVALAESAVVLSAARGRGYQRALLQARIAAARAQGRRWICSGVHLANLPSWRNLLASGFRVAGVSRALGEPIAGLLLRLDQAVARAA